MDRAGLALLDSKGVNFVDFESNLKLRDVAQYEQGRSANAEELTRVKPT